MEALIVQHEDRLRECEIIISAEIRDAEEYLNAAWERITPILEEIRERKLFAPKYKTFKQYMNQRWQKSSAWASQRIVQYKVNKNVKSTSKVISQHVLTTCSQTDDTWEVSDRNARHLNKLAPDEQAAVWEEAKSEGDTSEKNVKEKVRKISGGVTFDVDEIENYRPPKNGSPTINQVLLKKQISALDALARFLKENGLYDAWRFQLGKLRTELKELVVK